MRIVLDEHAFRTLVGGGVVEVEPGPGPTRIMLGDFGVDRMLDAIGEVIERAGRCVLPFGPVATGPPRPGDRPGAA